MSSEAFGWLLIAGSVLAYVRTQRGVPKSEPVSSPNPELANDPTRWRHNGDQPTYNREGNRMPVDDKQVTSLLMDSPSFWM